MREVIIKKLVEAVKEVAGESYLITTHTVKKNNGVELQAVNVRMQGDIISPNVYVDTLLEEIEIGNITVIEAAKRVFDIYQEHKNPELGIDINKLTDKDYILSNVEYQLINAKRNQEELKEIPSKKIVDLVAIYRTVISDDENGMASYVLSNQHLKLAGINIDELDEAAMRNTKKSGFSVKTMQEVMEDMMGLREEIPEDMRALPEIFVLTNNKKTNGANILFYKEQLAKVAEKIQNDFYIIPSSINELLAISVSYAEVEPLRDILKEVNDKMVDVEDILGYEIYRYNRETGEIEIAA